MGWPSPEVISAYSDLFRAFQWPLVALIISLFFRQQIRSVISRIKSGELFGQKFQIAGDLERLKVQVDESSHDLVRIETNTEEKLSFSERRTEAIEREVLEVASLSPRAAVMLVGSEIEQYMRWIADNAEYDVRPYASVPEFANAMVKEGVLSPLTRDSLNQFWRLRNRIVHEFAGDDKESLAATDIGLSLLRQIRIL